MKQDHFDIIIIGAGALGTFHAYHALESGKRVLLLEKDKRAQEATVRNFGQVVPSGLPPESEWHGFGRKATEVYQHIQQSHAIGIRNNGTCYIANTAGEMAVLEEMQQRFATADYESLLLTKDQVTDRYPAIKKAYTIGGLFFPQEVSAEPEFMIHKVQEYLSARFGDRFVYRNNSVVIDIEDKGGSCTVITAGKQQYTGAHCFVCSGRDFRILFPELFRQSGLVVSKLNMLSTVPQPGISLPGNILTGLSIRRYESFTTCAAHQQLDAAEVPRDCVDYGIHILFKQRLDGSIIIGDSHEYAPIADQDDLSIFYNDSSINDIILREAQKIATLEDWSVARTWNGFYTQHPDKEIFVEHIGERIHIVTGIGGKGMTTSAGFALQNLQDCLQEPIN